MRSVAFWLAVSVAGCTPAERVRSTIVPTWSLVEEQRIGGADSVYFTDIRKVLVGRDRTLYVIGAWDATHIDVIDSAGRLLRRLGRRGAGPGEFERVTNIGRLGDTIWAADEIRQRVTLFLPARAAIVAPFVPPLLPGARPLPDLPSTLLTGRVGVGVYRFGDAPAPPSVQVLVRVLWPAGRVAARSAGSESRDIRREGPEWRLVDTIATLSRKNAAVYTPVNMPGRNRPFRVLFSQPLADNALWYAAPDGRSLVLIDRPSAPTADTTSFTITRLTATGDTIYTRRFRYAPIDVPDALVDSILLRTEEGRLGMSRDAVYAPAFRSPITGAFIGTDGSVWIRREFSYGPRTTWSVVDPDGRWVGDVEVEARYELQAGDDRYVWATVRDGNDVPSIVRYRIVKPRQDTR